MNILVLNGSPRSNGNTAAMVKTFVDGAKEVHHSVTVVPVCQKKLRAVLPVNSAAPVATADGSNLDYLNQCLPKIRSSKTNERRTIVC